MAKKNKKKKPSAYEIISLIIQLASVIATYISVFK